MIPSEDEPHTNVRLFFSMSYIKRSHIKPNVCKSMMNKLNKRKEKFMRAKHN
jgi:hypothetical protein